jgi:ribosomal protein S27E
LCHKFSHMNTFCQFCFLQSGPGEVSAIGGAVYASISLANHACWPNVCRVSYGRRCVVRATRRLHPGEELLDNYGYSFLGVAGRERRLALRKQYFFECQCAACAEEWPLFAHLSPDNKYRCAKCGRVGLRPVCKNCGGPKGAAKTIERELRLANDR